MANLENIITRDAEEEKIGERLVVVDLLINLKIPL